MVEDRHKFALVRVIKTESVVGSRLKMVSRAPGNTKDIVVRSDHIDELIDFVVRKGRLVLVRKNGSPF